MNLVINQLIRSKRKSLMLQIKSDGSLVVKAPMRVSVDYINDFVKKKRNWIITKQLQIKNKISLHQQKLQHHGNQAQNKILLFGKYEDFLDKNLTNQNKIILLYKQEAMKYIALRVLYYAKIIDVNYKKIKITSARKRWGSCSSKGNLNFSWRLIMAPKQVVDYVIVHEVAHLLHKNHSSKFWKCVQLMMHDYKIHHLWLRDNGFLLDL